VLGLVILQACNWMPGRPSIAEQLQAQTKIVAFDRLYSDNCAGCHGADGRFGGALPLNNPAYLAIVDDASIRGAVAEGIAGTSMPAFAVESGGTLTDEQITAIVSGIRSRWGTGAVPLNAGGPLYTSREGGEATRGATLFDEYCGPCHGKGGIDGPAGAIAVPSFLELYNDQTLRTLIIAGRPDLGHPGWRDYRGKPPLDSSQVSDIVAWLATRRGT
jgi:mono/diheme cytochrome c family protein